MPKTFPTPKLVVFACDGVLVDSEPVSSQVLIANLAHHGLALTMEQSIELFVGGTMSGVMAKARMLGAELPEDWTAEVNTETYARLQQGVPLIPGIPGLLARLDAAGISVCVASNGSEEKMRITLGQNGLWERFHPLAMFSAHALGVAKPEPGLFLAAASHFGVQARDCLVIENSGSGVTAAVRAGMRCLGFAPQGGGKKLASLGAEVFTGMEEVPALLSI
ncbi:HAD family phosphatase [Leisingera sp. SS27]|uniref:HAD family hydrolase n=1 Tax=Leisingera sp. SS27 TaxID=2979462 RepID=UPI002330F469|nr:HAD family phosphatase [Leisingera sp. SS27]MDC0658638.1 HAD family phosphatase [Leisingera sp. SS27]